MGSPTRPSWRSIIGAFVAGLAIGRSDQHARIAGDLGSVGNVFIPVFFVQIGLDADLEAMVRPAVLGLAAALLVVAIVGKLASAGGTSGLRVDRLLVGIGMIPRGEVGLIFASIGLAEGVFGDDQYAALLIVILVTTLMTPPLLRWRIAGLRRRAGDDGRRRRRPASGTSPSSATASSSRPAADAADRPVALEVAPPGAPGDSAGTVVDWFGAGEQPRDVAARPTPMRLLDVLRRATPAACASST